MRTRCSNPQFKDWAIYGGRGISVCPEWNSFERFFADMGPKPGPLFTLDRIDSDGNYEPTNCRWATRKQQANNWKHRNRRVTFNGETLSLPEWAARVGITRESLRDRLDSGWTVEMAMTTPAVKNRRRLTDGTFATFGH